jgi:hypothetical protein
VAIYEDFTGYTEFDEGNDVTVDSATKVSWVNLQSRAETAYLYKDKGANHFSGDFTHKLELYESQFKNSSFLYHWLLGNIVGDAYDIEAASGDAVGVYSESAEFDAITRIGVKLFESGGETVDTWTTAGTGLSTLYFIEVVRDDDGGSNNTGRVTVYIRTGSHSGALQDTLVVDCSAGEQNDFRYIYALSTWDSGGSGVYATGYTQNLDVGEVETLSANDSSSLSQVTAPLLTVIRQCLIPNVESLSQITAPTVERGWLYPPDIPCNTEITVPSFTVKHSLSIPNIESLTQVTAPDMLVNHLGANNVSCNTEVTVPSFTVKRLLTIPNIESSSEVGVPDFVRQAPLNAPDISCSTEVTVASIYKELFPSDIECSSEVEAADLEWIKILKLNATLPVITAEMSGGHGGFLNVELPMITAEMRAGARLNVTLPMITAEIEGNVGIKADLNVTLPMIKVVLEGDVEVLGELNGTLPMVTARMTGTSGQVGQLNVTLPMITAELTGYTDINGQLNVTLPMIEAYLTGTVERESCEILRYEEPELE